MRRSRAFTLIELLVVIAIVAALASLTLGAIARVRQSARSVVCGSRLHDLAIAFQLYANHANDWLPGSPGTTGLELQRLDGLPGDAVDTPGAVVQNWDWQTPLVQYAMRIEAMEQGDRAQRWATLRGLQVLHCPSNGYRVDSLVKGVRSQIPDAEDLNGATTWSDLPMNSYATNQMLLYFGSRGSDAGIYDGIRVPAVWRVQTPASYVPRTSHIDRPGAKVLVSDGARITPHGVAAPSADIHYRAIDGGDFAAAGPPSSRSRAYVNPVRLEASDDPQDDRVIYRHGGGEALGLNNLMVDGHVEWMSKREAVSTVKAWYPTGTLVERLEFMEGPNPKPYAWSTVQSNFEPQPFGDMFVD